MSQRKKENIQNIGVHKTQQQTTQFKNGQRDMNKHFSKEGTWMAKEHIKICSMYTLIIKNHKIKTQGDTISHTLGWLLSRNIK